MAFDAELHPILAHLTQHPAALDALDLLASGPLSPRELGARLHARRRAVDAAVRALAAHGLVSRCGPSGSWDRPVRTCCELTPRGHDLARQLPRLDTLTAIYELLLYGRSSDGTACQ